MKNSLWILLVVGVLIGLLPATVSADPIADAEIPIDIIIDGGNSGDVHSKNGWLIAGSGVSSKIRVNYTGSVPLNISYVRFVSVEKDTYGDVSGEYATSLPCEAFFSASTNRAGNAPILVQINYSVNGTSYAYNRTVYQPIDHAAPMYIQNISFESEVSVGKEMYITMVMKDAYGNPVTSLFENETKGTPEMVTFETTRYADSGLSNASVSGVASVHVPVNADGLVQAGFMAGTEAGPKYLIHIVPPPALSDTWLTITALANAEPHGITVSVVPNTDPLAYVSADGASKFYLTYTLSDRYGNPSGNQAVCFRDDVIGDVFTQRTNRNGQIMFSFGPFDTAATFTIHAEAVANTSVTIDQQIRFASTSPEDMLLTASPQSMPSADVPHAGGAEILAKVMDENGNGVGGEVVTFWILNKSVTYCKEQTAEPTLNATTAETDEDGIAHVHFTPGAFEKNMKADNYNETASESCTVVAKWDGGSRTRSIDLEWKNYPYLRVETNVSQKSVNVGDSVDVTVRLIGDGYALYPDPIDVILCADRSGSMSGARITSLKKALKVFNSRMTEDRDQVGLVSFGTDVTRNLDFTLNRSKVDVAVDNLHASGWTSMRQGLFESIQECVLRGRVGVPQAVILLSDGDYNHYGDPLARGTGYTNTSSDEFPGSLGTDSYSIIPDIEQDLSAYAIKKNIPIYSIALGNGLSSVGNGTLKILANNTGGKYYYAPTGDDLAGIYTSIAGELKTDAGVNTAMDLNFDHIELNNVSTKNTIANPILEYEQKAAVSTLIKSWNALGSEKSPNIRGPLTIDQTDGWTKNRHLNFDSGHIGTLSLGQTWQAVFRLNVSKAGNINIFGDGSSIIFNNDTDTLALPKTYITALDNLTATGINFTGIRVYDLVCSGTGTGTAHGAVIDTSLTMDWHLNYSGSNTTTQRLYYQNVNDGFWTMFNRFDDTGPMSACHYDRKLYVADFPPGEYKIRVSAMAEDTPESMAEAVVSIGKGVKSYIRLE